MDSHKHRGMGAPSSSRYTSPGGSNASRGNGAMQRSQSAGNGGQQRYSGMVVLGGGKPKARGPVQQGSKLSIPRPVNLPSLRKEHGGNDPTTQLVNAGSIVGWNRQQDDSSAGSGGSHTGTAPGAGVGRQTSTPWQSGSGSQSLEGVAGPNSRAFPPLDATTARMNASDYPTLSAGTKQTSEFASSKPAAGRTSSEPIHKNFESKPWQDDERGYMQSRMIGSSWYEMWPIHLCTVALQSFAMAFPLHYFIVRCSIMRRWFNG
mmetsp:Transcript_38882/g.92093  ORF Transcript_38882/g.92093 Transcript_38882/m.92093 type:complete len:262 (+) Transcript_38882:889-1674(+)